MINPTVMRIEKTHYAWYAIYTRVNREKKIYSELQESNIECYLPVQKTLKQWSDRKKWIEEPLFRCYVFVRVSHMEFFKVLQIQGVVGYVRFGGKAQVIPNSQIEGVRAIVNQQEKGIELTNEHIVKGLRAEVLYGALKGIQGEIVSICGQYRLLIRLVSTGISLHVNISKDEVKIVENDEQIEQKPNMSLKHLTKSKPKKLVNRYA